MPKIRKKREFSMVWEIHLSQLGRIKILVRRLCSCFDRGNCILLDDGKPHKCVQLVSNSGVYCNYFKKAVLPTDKELYRQIRNYNKKGEMQNEEI